MEELQKERQIAPLPPVVIGGLLVIPAGLLRKLAGQPATESAAYTDTQAVAAHARRVIMDTERALGFSPTDREFDKLGYDIESRVPGTGRLCFLEVKGRISSAETTTVTKNEILYSPNNPEDFILAIVELQNGAHQVHYVRKPFTKEPDFGVTSVNYNFAELLARAEPPR